MAKRRQSFVNWIGFFLIFGAMGGFILFIGIQNLFTVFRSTDNLHLIEARVLDASNSDVRVGFILEGIPTEYILNPAPMGVQNNDTLELVIEDFDIESYEDIETGETEYYITNISAYSPKGSRQLGLMVIGFGCVFFAVAVWALVMMIKVIKHNLLFRKSVECQGVVREVIPTTMSVSHNDGPSRRICIFYITYVDEVGQYRHLTQREPENTAQEGFLVTVFHIPSRPDMAYADLNQLPSALEAQRFQEAHPDLMDIPFPEELKQAANQDAAKASVGFLMIFLVTGILMLVGGLAALLINISKPNSDLSSSVVSMVMGLLFTVAAIFGMRSDKKKKQ